MYREGPKACEFKWHRQRLYDQVGWESEGGWGRCPLHFSGLPCLPS